MPRTQKPQPTPRTAALSPEVVQALKAAEQALAQAQRAMTAMQAEIETLRTAKPQPVPPPRAPVSKPTRADRRAANRAAWAAQKAARITDPDAPATPSQLWFLHLLLNTDTRTPRYARLTKAQAARMIADLKAKKAAGTRSA